MRKYLYVLLNVCVLHVLFSVTMGASEQVPETIMFMGNSLSAGYGVGSNEAFPALIKERIDSLGWNFEVINAGLSGETSSAGLRRIDWLLRKKIDVLVLELGGNDALRGISIDLTRRNLQGIIDKAVAKYPQIKIVLAGMQAPPNLGVHYVEQFKAIFPALAESNDLTLIPFLLEGVGGIPELNQVDRIHPTRAGHKVIAENVWKILEPLLAGEPGEGRTK
jgi:acyl-CoA thioesterase-1